MYGQLDRHLDRSRRPSIGSRILLPAPWWVTIVIGILTVGGAFFAARMGARQTEEATEQRETAAAREEWFRRLQWAADLTLKPDSRSQAAGLAVLSALALSPLASMSDLDLLWSLNTNSNLNEVENDFGEQVDETDFVTDDEGDGDEEPGDGEDGHEQGDDDR